MTDVRPWFLLGSLLLVVGGCDESPKGGAVASASAEVPAPPGPRIEIGETNVLLDGAKLDVVRRMDEVGRMQKADKLFEALKKAREGDARGNSTASIRLAPKTSGVVFASVFQTATYAGFSSIAVLIGDRYLTFEGAIPHPCDIDPVGTVCNGYVAPKLLHAQPSGKGWTVRIPDDEAPIDDETEASKELAQKTFGDELRHYLKERKVTQFAIHLTPQLGFDELAPYLATASAVREGAKMKAPVQLRFNDIAKVELKPKPKMIGKTEIKEGKADEDYVRSVVRAQRDKFRQCYQGVLDANPKARGDITVKFVISPTGTVGSVAGDSGEGTAPGLVSCVTMSFYPLVFAAITEQVVVTQPLLFEPDMMKTK